MPIQTAIDSINNNQGSPFGFKNRIINGAMVIDQRNAGAAVTPTATAYTLDRWQALISTASKMTVQQTASTLDGFISSMGISVASATTAGAAEYFSIRHLIEGYNIADLGYGTATAKTVTLSFWVKSSVTGTYAGKLGNSANNRSYVFTYSISIANTFEYKTVTVVGDTSGTWLTTNGTGIDLRFDLGSGSNYRTATTGSWIAGDFWSTSSQVNWIGTAAATFYITGVQLEKGSTATSFDYRPYGTELALCQRYYEVIGGSFGGNAYLTTIFMGHAGFRVSKRAAPTLALLTTTPQLYQAGLGGVTAGTATNAASTANVDGFYMAVNGFAGLTAQDGCGMITASVFSATSEL